MKNGIKRQEKTGKLANFLEIENLANFDDKFFFHLQIAYENAIDGNTRDALYHLDNHCYHIFKNLPKLDKEKHLFRFVSFKESGSVTANQCDAIKEEIKKNDCITYDIFKDKKGLISKIWEESNCPIIKDVKERTITLSSPNGFNDPMDPLIKAWVERRKIKANNSEKQLYQLIENVLGKIRICCLVNPLHNNKKKDVLPKIEDCSPLMWGHYAKNHTGICIQYKVKPTNTNDDDDKIVRLVDVCYDKTFPLDGDISFVDSLSAKGDCWRYEKETRLIMYSCNEVSDYYQLPDFEIEAVYMGVRIESKKRNQLEKILKGTGIKLFQMSFSESDIRKLQSHEVK